MDSRQRRWDERYRDRPPLLPAAPTAAANHTELMALVPTTGRALDIACGAGAQSVWLAQRGMDVIALDSSSVAIGMVRDSAAANGVADRVDARVLDLDDGLPDDLKAFELIICQRFRNHSIFATLVDRLRPAGVGFVTVLSAVGTNRDPGPFHAAPGDLLDVFAGEGTEIVWHDEGGGSASIVVRRR